MQFKWFSLKAEKSETKEIETREERKKNRNHGASVCVQYFPLEY